MGMDNVRVIEAIENEIKFIEYRLRFSSLSSDTEEMYQQKLNVMNHELKRIKAKLSSEDLVNHHVKRINFNNRFEMKNQTN